MDYTVADWVTDGMLDNFNVVVEETDIEHAGTVLDMFVAFGNFDRVTKLAIVREGGLKVKIGIEWRFSWDSDGVEAAHVKFTDESGKASIDFSWDRKTVAGIVSADDYRAMIKSGCGGFPELKIMYSPDLIKRERIMSRVIDAISMASDDLEQAKSEVASGE